MVLWEITVATAYFVGLKRTYKLALKLQRRVATPRHPKLRGFLHRRTRAAFDIALTVHRKIQEKDIEAGRTLGNWILSWVEPMKPSAQVQCSPVRPVANRLLKQIESSVRASIISQRPNVNRFMDRGFRHHLFVLEISVCCNKQISPIQISPIVCHLLEQTANFFAHYIHDDAANKTCWNGQPVLASKQLCTF